MDLIKTWLLYPLPQHWISRVVYFLTRRRTALRLPVMRWFIRHFGVVMSEAAEPDPRSYPTFNAFFTRALRADARPLDPGADVVVSPVDGTLSEAGPIRRQRLLQAKGMDYSVAALLGGDETRAQAFENGVFATIYLSPRDYHRIHMPIRGRLLDTTYVPGRLFSVAPHTVRSLPGLFTRNERVSAVFDTEAGLMAMVLVGAINVAAIETVWSGLVTPPRGQRIHRWRQPQDQPYWLDKGAEMGRFNMGSTVILLMQPGSEWLPPLQAGAKLRMGQAIGRFRSVAQTPADTAASVD